MTLQVGTNTYEIALKNEFFEHLEFFSNIESLFSFIFFSINNIEKFNPSACKTALIPLNFTEILIFLTWTPQITFSYLSIAINFQRSKDHDFSKNSTDRNSETRPPKKKGLTRGTYSWPFIEVAKHVKRTKNTLILLIITPSTPK